jgi:hypothetical protein
LEGKCLSCGNAEVNELRNLEEEMAKWRKFVFQVERKASCRARHGNASSRDAQVATVERQYGDKAQGKAFQKTADKSMEDGA